MALNNFPYTNVHELNLDWIIKTVKEWVVKNEELEISFNDLKESNEAFIDYVTTYLETLDISEEVRRNVINTINNMINSGEMQSLIAPLISPLIQDYSTPVIVTSVADMTDPNHIYLYTDGFLYFWNGSAFQNSGISYSYDNSDYVHAMGRLEQGSDLNNVSPNTIYLLQANYNYQNIPPEIGSGMLFTFTSANYTTQFAYNTFGLGMFRRKVSNNWSSWVNITTDMTKLISIPQMILPNDTDLNSITDSSVYFCFFNNEYQNIPEKSGYLITLKLTGAYQAQFFIGYNTYNIYHRRSVTLGGYNEWNIIHIGDRSPVNIKANIFGDSIVYGQVGSTSGNRADFYTRIPFRISKACNIYNTVNNAVSGTPYVPRDIVNAPERCIAYLVENSDISDSNLIVVYAGRNDTEHPLGSVDDVAGSWTICGQIKRIINYIKSNNPTAQVIFVTPTPQTRNDEEVWTKRGSGGWSLNDFNTVVKELLDMYNTPLIDMKHSAIYNNWSTVVANSDMTHPDNQKYYHYLGDYVAGQISKYFHN